MQLTGLLLRWSLLCAVGLWLCGHAAAQPDVPAQSAPGQDAPVGDAPAENAPAENAPAENAPVGDAPVGDAPVENAPGQDAPVGDAPAENAPVGDAPVEDAPAENVPPQPAEAVSPPAPPAPASVEPAPPAPASVEPAPVSPPAPAETSSRRVTVLSDDPTLESPDRSDGGQSGDADQQYWSDDLLQEGGSWSGALHLDLGYYWENSTRIVMPQIEVEAESPTGLRISAGYLVDVITSASIGFGVTKADMLHREYRHQPAAGLGKEFELGRDKQLDVQLNARMSTEPDYVSLPFVSTNLALSMNQRNTILRAGASIVRDTIFNNNDPTVEERLDGVSLVAGAEQILNRYMVVSGVYQYGRLSGFLGNVYRRVQLESAPIVEQPPDSRHRHALALRVQGIVPASGTALHLMAKGYTDSWGVEGIAPEARVYQSLGESLLLRLRYRYYAQTRADFQRDVYPSIDDWGDRGTTSDPKLAAFDSHMVGVRIDVFTGFLEDTFLGFAQDASAYIAADRQFSGISYGVEPMIIGSAGGTLPF